MPKPWRLAKSLDVLRKQINRAAPSRSRVSDGTIGNARHATRKSDHNPDDGIVHAIDITHDPIHGCSGIVIAEALRTSKDPRIGYVIFNRRIFSSTVRPWLWRTYAGKNPHTKHIHISVTKAGADDTTPWKLGLED